MRKLKTIQKRKMAKNKLKSEVRTYIVNWNRMYPIDYWWRKKYNIPFGSEKHRQADFIQMYFDYEEDKMMKQLMDSEIDKSESNFEEENAKHGVGPKMTQDQIDYDFENIDLSNYNTVKESKKKDG